jgi:hypothetical protein
MSHWSLEDERFEDEDCDEGHYTLVVVDMQPVPIFPAAYDRRTIANVAREIDTAVSLGADVVIAEISHWGNDDFPSTHEEIIEHLRGYQRFTRAYKDMYNYGGGNVIQSCLSRNFALKRIRLCGINSGGWIRQDGQIQKDPKTGKPRPIGCVFCMALDLRKLLPGSVIEVVEDACNDVQPNFWEDYQDIGVMVIRPDELMEMEAA